jgi:LmbE family N-acetylglucosaminyl deacetylase
MDISEQIDVKIKAISCYQSQFLGIDGGLGEMVTATSRYFGTRIATAHAEPFYSQEVLGFSGLSEMVFNGR